MKRALVAVALTLIAFTGCLPQMKGGGWAWDPSPSRPIVIEDSTDLPGTVLGAAAQINQAAGTQVFAVVPPGTPANVEIRRMTPICPLQDAACTSRRHMWVDVHRVGTYIDHCTIYIDLTMWWILPIGWDGNSIAHETMHCLDYPDVNPPTDYHGVLSSEGWYDQAWRAAYWWQADDRAILTRDGYGP